MDSGDRMADIEALKQLKARYCRLLDAKDWVAWRGLFADDFVGDTSEAGGRRVVGADAFVAFVRANLGARHKITVHQVHAPEIELGSETAARGIWALNDIVRLMPGITLHGYGHYHETYRKTGGEWRFESSRLTRLREDLETPILKLRIPDGLRNLMAAMARRGGG